MKKIYSYYESIATANQPEEFTCSNWWKKSWTENGWEPIMLNRTHAQGSPLYNKLIQKIMNCNLGLPPELAGRFHWFSARYARLCALHAAGGGWMCDYDVLNKGFKPEQADNTESDGTLQINAGSAYIFYATKDHLANAIKKIVNSDLCDKKSFFTEDKILQIKGGLKPICKLLVHAKSKNGVPRSGIMQNSYEK